MFMPHAVSSVQQFCTKSENCNQESSLYVGQASKHYDISVNVLFMPVQTSDNSIMCLVLRLGNTDFHGPFSCLLQPSRMIHLCSTAVTVLPVRILG